MAARQPPLPIEVEFALLDTLHSSLKSLLIGHLSATAALAVAGFVGHNLQLLGLAALILAATVVRFTATFFYRRLRFKNDRETLEKWKARTAAATSIFAASLGVGGFIGVHMIGDAALNTLLVAIIVGYAVTSASRNAGFPVCALIQILLATLPLSAAMILHGGAIDLTIGLLTAGYILALRELSMSIYSTLLNALMFGREKQTLAEEKQTLVEEVSEQAAKFDTALSNMPHGLAMFDARERLVICNKRFAEFFRLDDESGAKGASPTQIILSAARSGLIESNKVDAVAAQFAAHIKARVHDDMNLQLADGRGFELSFQSMARGGSVVIVDDVTQRQAQDAKIAHMARFDRLTNLPNRAQFEEKFDEAWAQSRRTGHPFAVVCIDLDHFKEVNDTLTHIVGDLLLVAVAERMRGAVRASDHLARFGGDEFMLILANLDASTASDDVAVAIQHLSEIVSAPYEIDSHKIVIGMSAGVALAPADGRSRDELFRAADLALYKTKHQSRGGCSFFEASLDASAQERRQNILDMRAGIAQGQFHIEYQPIIDLTTGQIASCEALMRWDHPTRKMSPDKFIPVAEDTGMIVELGQWALYKACRDAAAWPEQVSVAVNLSPVQFKRENLVETIAAALRATGLDPRRLELEITESLLISGDEMTKKIVDGIIGLGCSLSLDDFGTGYSTFGYLTRYPFKKVKLDKGFIDHIETRPDHRAILKAVCQMAQEMSMSLVAEGVENLSQIEILDTEHVRYAQGWYFSKSLANAEIPWRTPERASGKVWRAA